ncbi:MAG: M20/M25/M40 family metallo-hydrolase [Chloroflexi bacterium CFX4]|nr:M20/M25/M40 family metallo-hydrolase [Chloroflexi bacterium CFX4]MDL1923197.1 M20/M25/M40 family metallo-hydrolase [Chloroflexi bacterium CFX3]
MNRLRRATFCTFAILSLLACALTTPEQPSMLNLQLPTPTLAPLATPTPQSDVQVGRPLDRQVWILRDEVQNDRLMHSLSRLVGFGTRHVLSPVDRANYGIGAARDWLFQAFEAIRAAHPSKPIQVWTQPVWYTWQGQHVRSENVIAVLQGSDVGAGVYVVGAHYDSIGAPPTDGNAYAPGANDNGSGVAALLEIAQIMAGQPQRATLIFVAFTAEETGRQGSLAFVENYLQAHMPPIALRGMLNLDMLGSMRDANGRTDSRTLRLFSAAPNDSPSRQLARQVALAISTYTDEVLPVLQSSEDRIGRWGDQMSFSAAGYPAVRLIQSLEDHTRQHNGRDSLEAIDLDYLMRTTRAALTAVAVLSGGLAPPAAESLRLTAIPNGHQLVWAGVPQAVAYVVALRQTASLGYDMLLTVNSALLTWDQFMRYEAISIAAVDANGRFGGFSPEVKVRDLLR